MLAALQRTSSLLHATALKYAAHARPRTRRPTPLLAFDNLVLPIPDTPAPRLVSLGVDEATSRRIASVFTRFCDRLKSHLEEDYRRRSQSLQKHASYYQDSKSLSSVTLAYLVWYKKATQEWRSYILDDFAPRLVRARSISSANGRRPFNQAAVPILEQFFSQNAFPTRLEKLELASKCSMDYKQIHTWFQNRRSRLKKEGKVLPGRERTGGLAEELENAVMGDLLPPFSCDESQYTFSPSDCQGAEGHFNFMIAGAAHAFPSTYPPVCSYDPFPPTPEGRRLDLPWIRKAKSTVSATTNIVVEDLIAAFAEMAIADDSDSDSPCTRPHTTLPWTGLATRCPPAPHPALIRGCKGSSMATIRPLSPSLQSVTCRGPSANAPRRTRAYAKSPSPAFLSGHPSNCTIPNLTSRSSSNPPKHSLPRRVPQHASVNHPKHVTSPAPSPTSRNHSRSASGNTLSSDTVWSGSECSSPPSTPPIPPLALPSYVSPRVVIDEGMGLSLPSDLFSWLATNIDNPFSLSPASSKSMHAFHGDSSLDSLGLYLHANT